MRGMTARRHLSQLLGLNSDEETDTWTDYYHNSFAHQGNSNSSHWWGSLSNHQDTQVLQQQCNNWDSTMEIHLSRKQSMPEMIYT